MWLNFQICSILVFATNLSSGDLNLPYPGLGNFLKISLLNYKRWIVESGLDPSEKIPFLNLTDYEYLHYYSEDYVGNLTNFSIESHSNLQNVTVRSNHKEIFISFKTKGYFARGTYVLEGINGESGFNGTGELFMECTRGSVSLTCNNIGLTPEGFLDLSSASFRSYASTGFESDCRCSLENFNGTSFYTGDVAGFACDSLGRKMELEGLNPLVNYLKLYLEQLFKANSKQVIANITLPADLVNSTTGIEHSDYARNLPGGAHPGISYPIPECKPTLHATDLATASVKNLPVPGLQNFLTVSMNHYKNWILNKGLDPSEKTAFVNLTDSKYNGRFTLFGNIRNTWIQGHSNINGVYVHATETEFTIYIYLDTFSLQGTYSIEGFRYSVAFKGSGTFKTDCYLGYVYIVCRNIQVRDGYIDLSSAFIRTGSNRPWKCDDIFKNITTSSVIRPFALSGIAWEAWETYNKRVAHDGSPLTIYLKMYLEELFKTTPVDVIAKTTLPPNLAALLMKKCPNKNDANVANQAKIAPKNNLHNTGASEVGNNKTGTASCRRVHSYFFISAVLILILDIVSYLSF